MNLSADFEQKDPLQIKAPINQDLITYLKEVACSYFQTGFRVFFRAKFCFDFFNWRTQWVLFKQRRLRSIGKNGCFQCSHYWEIVIFALDCRKNSCLKNLFPFIAFCWSGRSADCCLLAAAGHFQAWGPWFVPLCAAPELSIMQYLAQDSMVDRKVRPSGSDCITR